MKFLIGARASGKTRRMLEWAHQNPGAVIVAANHRLVHHMLDEAKRLKLDVDSRNVISMYAALYGHALYGRDSVTLGLDNVECLLPEIFSHPVELVTASAAVEVIDLEAARRIEDFRW